MLILVAHNLEKAGKEVYCPPPGLKGGQVMTSLDQFLESNPDMAERYGRKAVWRRDGGVAEPGLPMQGAIGQHDVNEPDSSGSWRILHRRAVSKASAH